MAYDLIREVLASGNERYAVTLSTIGSYLGDSREMSHSWGMPNCTFPAFDALAYWTMLKSRRPPRIMEVGSGHSTLLALDCRAKGHITSSLTVVDPGDGINNLGLDRGFEKQCDTFIKLPAQGVDPEMFRSLEAGDFLFWDGCHICAPGSDVTYFFLEVLPRLKTGVIVHLHDILWPEDYPVAWHARGYNEHYLMGVLLLADAGRRYSILLPNRHILIDPSFAAVLQPFRAAAASVGSELTGSAGMTQCWFGYQGTSFWMEIK